MDSYTPLKYVFNDQKQVLLNSTVPCLHKNVCCRRNPQVVRLGDSEEYNHLNHHRLLKLKHCHRGFIQEVMPSKGPDT